MKNDYPFNWCIPDLDKKRCSSQIEAFIIENIKSGNLCAGDAVPGYRKLAELNSIGFNSIRRAYARLITGHWLETRNGAGTFVSEKETEQNSAGRFGSVADEFPAGLDLMQLMSSKRANALQPFTFVGTDFPHPALFPEDRFFRYCHKHRNMSAHLSQSQLLTAYGGHYLKQAVMDDLNKNRGFDLNLNLLQINNGREDTLKMAFRMLLVKPGELVINTSLHDPVVLEILNELKADVLPVWSCHPGFIDLLERTFTEFKVRAVYIRPQCSFPESYTINTEDCIKLIELAKKHKVCLVEEEDDHEFWLGSKPYKPLSCYDHGGFVIYIAALSKARPDMQALRVIVASAQLIKMMDSIAPPVFEDRNIINEKGIADLILNGDLQAYRRVARHQAVKNRHALDVILQNYLGENISYTLPEHGLTFWIHFNDRFDLNVMLNNLEKKGIPVPYHPKNQAARGKLNDMVLGFGAFDIREAEGAAKLLKEFIGGYDVGL